MKYYSSSNGVLTEKSTESAETFTLTSDTTRVFTTLATHNTPTPALLCLDLHLSRLISNAKAAGIYNESLVEHQPDKIQEILLRCLQNFIPSKEYRNRVRIRVVLSNDNLEIHLSEFSPRWPLGTTISAIMVEVERPNAEIKSTAMIGSLKGREAAEKAEVGEAFLVDPQGYLREGSYSNIFWFDSNNELYTVDKKVLHGTTRQLVIDNEPCSLVEIKKDDFLHSATEVFVTQSTTGVTPVVKIDAQAVGDGRAGENTLKLQARYIELVKKIAKPIYD